MVHTGKEGQGEGGGWEEEVALGGKREGEAGPGYLHLGRYFCNTYEFSVTTAANS